MQNVFLIGVFLSCNLLDAISISSPHQPNAVGRADADESFPPSLGMTRGFCACS